MVLKDENGNELNYTLGQYEGDSTFLKVMKINILQGLSEREALKQYSTPVYINESIRTFARAQRRESRG